MIHEFLISQHSYVLVVVIMNLGLYMIISSPNLVKKVIGLNMFQSTIFLFFISTGYVKGGQIPVVSGHANETATYANPLPHVIVLTAIVVGVALTSVAMALIIRIYDEYGTLNEDNLEEVRKSDS